MMTTKSKALKFPTIEQWNPSVSMIRFAQHLNTNNAVDTNVEKHAEMLATLRGFGLVQGGGLYEDDDFPMVTAAGEAWLAYINKFIKSPVKNTANKPSVNQDALARVRALLEDEEAELDDDDRRLN